METYLGPPGSAVRFCGVQVPLKPGGISYAAPRRPRYADATRSSRPRQFPSVARWGFLEALAADPYYRIGTNSMVDSFQSVPLWVSNELGELRGGGHMSLGVSRAIKVDLVGPNPHNPASSDSRSPELRIHLLIVGYTDEQLSPVFKGCSALLASSRAQLHSVRWLREHCGGQISGHFSR